LNAGRHAVTRARLVEGFGTPPGAMLVECRLETGRTHQIRVHMAHAGWDWSATRSMVGQDAPRPRRWGRMRRPLGNFPRQALHAATLGFDHPVSGGRLEFTSPLPADMAGLLDKLRDGPAAGT
jgi:23S rRNA pseudouridine1911/1915/1917 synthase